MLQLKLSIAFWSINPYVRKIERLHRSRVKTKRFLEEYIFVDEGSGCTSKQEDMMIDENCSDNEINIDFYCSESGWDLLFFVNIA